MFQQVRAIMGSANRCSQGEIHRFNADQTVAIERCTSAASGCFAGNATPTIMMRTGYRILAFLGPLPRRPMV